MFVCICIYIYSYSYLFALGYVCLDYSNILTFALYPLCQRCQWGCCIVLQSNLKLITIPFYIFKCISYYSCTLSEKPQK